MKAFVYVCTSIRLQLPVCECDISAVT